MSLSQDETGVVMVYFYAAWAAILYGSYHYTTDSFIRCAWIFALFHIVAAVIMFSNWIDQEVQRQADLKQYENESEEIL